MISVNDRVFMNIIGDLNNYEKLWLWWLIWGGNPANAKDVDCNDY